MPACFAAAARHKNSPELLGLSLETWGRRLEIDGPSFFKCLREHGNIGIGPKTVTLLIPWSACDCIFVWCQHRFQLIKSMNHPNSDSFRSFPAHRPSGFTLVELLVVITIIVVLAALSFSGYSFTMKKVRMGTTMDNMRQLATGTLLYSQDHNGCIPRGDDGADGAGVGGRGLILINHIGPNIGYPELETEALNKAKDGMDQWTYLLTKYKTAPFVCGGFDQAEQVKAKAKTQDAMGGIGYNVQPLLASVGGSSANNASWGNISETIPYSRITNLSSRCMAASSYDWHLVGENTRAYNRFGKDKAAMVFWDGSCRLVTKIEYNRAIDTPDLR